MNNATRPAAGDNLAGPHESAAEPPRARPWAAATSLAWREIVRFLRQPNRIIGAVGQPVIFWLLFGAGLSQSFQVTAEGDARIDFREYFFPGALMLIVLFTAIFATISIIEDRREGFLQAVLVSPTPRWAMVLGKAAGGMALALAEGLIFLLLGLSIVGGVAAAQFALAVLMLVVAGLGLTSLGIVIAWRTDSTQGFHAIMSVLLFPMWLLSGAFFPIPAAAANAAWGQAALHWVMRLNPLSYGVAGLQHTLSIRLAADGPHWSPSPALAWSVTVAFTAIMFIFACRVARRSTSGDLL